MRYRRLLGGGLLALFFVLGGCSGISTAPPSKSPSSSPGGPSASNGPVVYVLATELIRSTPVEQVLAVQAGSALWTGTLPATGSALSLRAGVLYVGAGDTIFALNAANGQKKWTATVSSRVVSLTTDGDLLIAETGIGGSGGELALDILNAGDGSLRWSLAPTLGVSGWLLDKGTLFAVETGFPPQLLAADVMTGTPLWRVSLPNGVVSGAITAFLPTDSDALLLVTDQSIALLTQDKGALVWLRENSHNLDVTILSGVVYAFYVDTATAFGGNQVVGLRGVRAGDDSVLWNRQLASDDAAYLSFQKALTVGAITSNAAYLIDGPSFGQAQAWNLSGQALWSVSNTNAYAVLAVGNQAIYLTSTQGITALDALTGKQSWNVPTPAAPASLQATNGRLYGVDTPNKTLYVLSASTGQLNWRFTAYQLHLYAVAN